MIIKSPFNFVPLSDKVFSPEWEDEISQDIPFSDGVSGTIGLTITAESPIFVGNGQPQKEDKEKEDHSFSHIVTPDGNRYFIPGTSIKGEVRNILEIMSYGKMCVDERAKFARRDLNDSHVYPLPKEQKHEHCGWLRKNRDNFEIIDCGKCWRISHPEIDRFLGEPLMRNNFSEEKNEDAKLEDNQKTAIYKYDLIKDHKGSEHILENLSFEVTNEKYRRVKVSSDGDIHGIIVFTGQPSFWKKTRGKMAGKYYEFVFPEQVEAIRKISGEEFKHFEFIYKKTKGDKESEDWKRIKKLLDESEHGSRGVPVFFLPKGNDGVEHFGMAYLYKMPYDRSVFESLPKDHQEKGKRDLAECIFGYTDKQDALKGRVQFGHAFVPDGVQVKPLPIIIRLVLGSPKASYYPLYISQNGKGGVTSDYETYDHGTPSGWKRYYVRKDTDSVRKTDGDADTFMEPLDKGATFHGTVTFHNLRPVELGALLSALTFHDTPQCRHQLGMAKPYGFGKCRYSIKLNISSSQIPGQPKDENYYMARFEKCMSDFLKADWTRQPQIKELFTMAGSNVGNGGAFDYMIMANASESNEFEKAKKSNEYLQNATILLNQTITPKTLCDTPEFKAELEAVNKHEEEKEAEIERQRRLDELRDIVRKKKQAIVDAGNDKYILNDLRAEFVSMQTDDKDLQDIIAQSISMIDEKLAKIRLNELREFKEAYETKITNAGNDKYILNIIKGSLGSFPSGDKEMADLVKTFIAEIEERLTLIEKEAGTKGFQHAFKTAITDYKLFEIRLKTGLRTTPKEQLIEEDLAFGAARLQDAYNHDVKQSPKNWATTTGSYFKRCAKIVGNDIATEWFTKLKR